MTPAKPQPGPPMDLDNMRANNVRNLSVDCLDCGHHALANVDNQPGHLTVPSFAGRMVCGKCGSRRVAVRPNWLEAGNTPRGW